MALKIEDKEKIEIDFWKTAPEENPTVHSIPNLINKFGEAAIFLDKIFKFKKEFSEAATILELGGGQCWSACMLKHYHPDKRIIASDISPYAIESAPRWEGIFKVKLDGVIVAKSYEIPLPDDSVDVVYCFASAHHFVRHRTTFKELHRVLKDGGKVIYLHEPVCTKLLHSMAKKRANAKRPAVPEDVLIYGKLLKIAMSCGFKCRRLFAPTTRNRSPFGTIYYSVLSRLIFLQKVLPCTADMVFSRSINKTE